MSLIPEFHSFPKFLWQQIWYNRISESTVCYCITLMAWSLDQISATCTANICLIQTEQSSQKFQGSFLHSNSDCSLSHNCAKLINIFLWEFKSQNVLPRATSISMSSIRSFLLICLSKCVAYRPFGWFGSSYASCWEQLIQQPKIKWLVLPF